jgi:hypothetical protein
MGARGKKRLAFTSNHFQVFAHGVAVDPDACLASTTLGFDGVWRKGERGFDHPKSNGVFEMLGDGRTLPISEQQRIAIDFLSTQRDALRAVAAFPGVTTFILGLQHRANKSWAAFCLGPGPRLMDLALDIGIRTDVLRDSRVGDRPTARTTG